MKQIRRSVICAVVLLPILAYAGERIDGVVATVNHQAILQSEWDDATRFEAFMQQKPLSAVTDTDRVSALQRLIDQRLLEMQMSDRSSLVPSRDELHSQIAKLRAQVPVAKDDLAWRTLVASYGLTERRLEEHLRTETEMMNFIEVRLRPAIHVHPEEIEAYYESQLLPDMEKAGVKIVTLQEVSPNIRELLVQRRMDEMLDAWLHNLRQQTPVQSTVPLPPESENDRVSGS